MAKKQRSPGDWVQLKINVRERVRAKLEQAAASNGHPMNVEISNRLERSFDKEDQAALIKTTVQTTVAETMLQFRSSTPKTPETKAEK